MVLFMAALLSIELPLSCWELTARCIYAGAQIIVPTGALCGLDAVRAAAEGGNVQSVTMRTAKPPSGLANAPFVVEQNIDLR